MRPAHTVSAREESGEGPKECDEPPEEDNLAAVTQKQILAHLEPRLIQSDVFAVSHDQANPYRTTDQVADVVAADRWQRVMSQDPRGKAIEPGSLPIEDPCQHGRDRTGEATAEDIGQIMGADKNT